MAGNYAMLNPSRGGKRAACVLCLAMLGGAAIMVAAVFIGIKISSTAGVGDPPAPPPPPPISPVNVEVKSIIQMSLLFLESQKSGHLPADYPITWRNHSGLYDGQDQNRNLTGGFYDGGGSIKYTFPMAYSITMLSWSVIEYQQAFIDTNTIDQAISLIQWGVDYLLKAKYQNIIFAQVGVPEIDSTCWMRPEDMTPAQRPTPFPCEETHPCSDLAGEMAAALAASSIIFRKGNPQYANSMVAVAKELFVFATTYEGKYSDWVVESQAEYNSTGYKDEIYWAAAWLYFASGDESYMNNYLLDYHVYEDLFPKGELPTEFSWDKKTPGVMLLMTRVITIGYGISSTNETAKNLAFYMDKARQYVCQFQEATTSGNFTSGGLLSWGDMSQQPLQYSISNGFLSLLLVDYLLPADSFLATPTMLPCGSLDKVAAFAKAQQNYVLGMNRLNMSYMVGNVFYGSSYPAHPYHKGSSIPSKLEDPTVYDCITGDVWRTNSAPNPNILVGAVVGGPDHNDSYPDVRSNQGLSEPKLYINAVWTGLLAGLHQNRPGIDFQKIFVQLPKLQKNAITLSERQPRASPPPPSPPVSPPPYQNPPPPPPSSPPLRIQPPPAQILKHFPPPPGKKGAPTPKTTEFPPPAKKASAPAARRLK